MTDKEIQKLVEEYKKLRDLTEMPDWVYPLINENPEAFRHYFGLIRSTMLTKKVLPSKFKELLCVTIGVALGSERIMKPHIRQALKAGASREEVIETILLSMPILGFQTLQMMLRALEIMEKHP